MIVTEYWGIDEPPFAYQWYDQRPFSTDAQSRICPKQGKAAALVMPWRNTHAMNQHLIEISRNVDDNAHAVLIMDQAG